MPPAYRNPKNDPPRLGEMIHYRRSHDWPVNMVECPAIVNAVAHSLREFHAAVLCPFDAETKVLEYDDYDPTPDPAGSTWHFDHRS